VKPRTVEKRKKKRRANSGRHSEQKAGGGKKRIRFKRFDMKPSRLRGQETEKEKLRGGTVKKKKKMGRGTGWEKDPKNKKKAMWINVWGKGGRGKRRGGEG